jgi:hypothetical protein
MVFGLADREAEEAAAVPARLSIPHRSHLQPYPVAFSALRHRLDFHYCK